MNMFLPVRRAHFLRGVPAALIAAVALGCGNHGPQGEKMPRRREQVSEETARFHQIVKSGALEELSAALEGGAAVNAPGRLGETALMVAINASDLRKTKLLVDHGADPELTDDFNATALRYAVAADFEDGVRFLLSLGVDRGHHPKYPLKKVDYDYPFPDVEMPEELKAVMSEAEWKESMEETRESVIEMGQNPTVEPMISDVRSVAVLKLFLAAGDELDLAPTEMKRALVGLETGGTLRSALSDYREQKSPRYGTRNPERMDLEFWRDMVRTGGSAYFARRHFGDTEAFTSRGAVWCYDRFGSTLSQLKDGRFVQIGGEHEDYYDPDFWIYNDVVVHDGRGGFEIYGYPREVFPPTDFHTATLAGDSIYVVGCLGYPEQRKEGHTPVYRLKLESWKIEAVETSGEMPGWIHGHRSRYDPAGNAISVTGGDIHVIAEDGHPELKPNDEQFELELSSFRWRKTK